MKTSAAILALGFALSASGQYFSEGWKPGQAVSKQPIGDALGSATAGYSPESTPGEQSETGSKSLSSLFDLTNLLQTGPAKSLFGSMGVNISEKIALARLQAKLWDERIPLITDNNYQSMITEERFASLDEEKRRVWFIAITASSAQPESISRYVDEQFDKAYNLTQEAKDLQHIRWGRIDYMNVTALTTKWNVWRAPFLVVLKDRGQTLRFYRPQELRLQPEILREFLRRDFYEQTPPWQSAFGPGGSREFVLDYLSTVLTSFYNYSIMVPKWALLLITGSLASFLVNILHSSRLFATPPPPTNRRQSPERLADVRRQNLAGSVLDPQTSESGMKSSKGQLGRRKGGKK